ncbi:MAG TPA: hypothetical protein VII49_14315 [Rhizomicrobium sp.]
MSLRDRRAITRFDIVAKRKRGSVAVASPADFELRHAGESSGAGLSDEGTVYCADFSARRLFFVICDRRQEVLTSPFLYLAQFEQATQIVSVPFERLQEVVPDVVGQPVIVFSIGRCGSTLLAKLLNAVGTPTVSEPDVFTQIADRKRVPISLVGSGIGRTLIRACAASFNSSVGPRFAVKLRSQCNGIASLIAQSLPEAEFIFMMRERISWARSRFRAFGGEPEALARMFRWGIESFHNLSISGNRPKLVWYQDVVENPLQAVRDLGFEAGGPDSFELVETAMRQDSQQGSRLQRELLPAREMSTDQFQAFEREWQAVRPGDLISRYSLERIG